MHLRYLTRLHVTAALVILSIVFYSAWIYPTLRVNTRLTKAWTGSSRRLIVFGDSFSDTGDYTVGSRSTSKGSGFKKDLAEGSRWTEVLCTESVCDAIVNFARTSSDSTTYSGGVVVDNAIYANTTSHNETALALLPDLKEQIQQWLDYEEEKGDAEAEDEFMFSISLGFWDIWQYATLDLGPAQEAISNSIYELFQQLDVIAEHFDEPPRIVIPKLWDLTFTPRFLSLSRAQSEPRFGEQQHKVVYLTKYWNTVMMQSAANWRRGLLYIPDWNTWLLDEIRSTQMQSVGFFDHVELGQQIPNFKDVSQPCVVSAVGLAGSGVDDMQVSRCKDPKQHLWWDDTQFSCLAHEILGKDIARLIHSNETANAQVRMHASATDGNSGSEVLRVHLTPSLAPGN